MTSIVITGASRGIGLELARQLAERGDAVIAACRKSSPQLEALNVDIRTGVDVADERCVQAFANSLDTTVEVLINNAGMLSNERLDDIDFDRIRRQLEVNTLGPLRMTVALLPHMVAGGKVAIISSRVGSLQDNTSGGMYGYRMSKAAVNMVGVNLAHDLRGRGISVVILHPGYVRTKMTGGHGNIASAEAARGLIARIDALSLEDTGTFWHAEGYALPW